MILPLSVLASPGVSLVCAKASIMNSRIESCLPGLAAIIMESIRSGTLYCSMLPRKVALESGSCSFPLSILNPRMSWTKMQSRQISWTSR